MYACQAAMKMVPGKKSPEVSALLIAVMDWLEQCKKEHRDVEGITDEVAAQALIEEYALQLFTYADAQDKAENFNKNTIKAFYTAGILMDIIQQFGEVSEDIANKRKYAKWKAAYIHTCLKNGETPMPGALEDSSVEKNLIDPRIQNIDEPSPYNDAPPVQPTPPNEPAVQPQNPSIPPSPAGTPGPSNGQPQFPTYPTVNPTYVPQPVAPQPATPSVPLLPAATGEYAKLSPEQMEKAQKYCKWAASALMYDDVKTAVDNLHKALNLLQLGKE